MQNYMILPLRILPACYCVCPLQSHGLHRLCDTRPSSGGTPVAARIAFVDFHFKSYGARSGRGSLTAGVRSGMGSSRLEKDHLTDTRQEDAPLASSQSKSCKIAAGSPPLEQNASPPAEKQVGAQTEERANH